MIFVVMVGVWCVNSLISIIMIMGMLQKLVKIWMICYRFFGVNYSRGVMQKENSVMIMLVIIVMCMVCCLFSVVLCIGVQIFSVNMVVVLLSSELNEENMVLNSMVRKKFIIQIGKIFWISVGQVWLILVSFGLQRWKVIIFGIIMKNGIRILKKFDSRMFFWFLVSECVVRVCWMMYWLVYQQNRLVKIILVKIVLNGMGDCLFLIVFSLLGCLFSSVCRLESRLFLFRVISFRIGIRVLMINRFILLSVFEMVMVFSLLNMVQMVLILLMIRMVIIRVLNWLMLNNLGILNRWIMVMELEQRMEGMVIRLQLSMNRMIDRCCMFWLK